MAQSDTKTEIKVRVDIKPVKLTEVTPAQRQLCKRFWAKLISQVMDEVKGER